MSEQTPNLSLPFIQPAQAQKHVTHNEAIELLDMIVQLTIENFDATIPPGTAAEGQAWVLSAAPTGAWAGQDNMIATWRGGGWLFVAPRDGWLAWGRAVQELRVFTGGSWVVQGADPVLENLTGVGINATSDATNRLSLSSAATLLNHEGAGHQVKINKAAAGDTASLLYQTGFSGRAEMGLTGSDDFGIKVSPDGAAWKTALSIGAATGSVQIGDVLNLTPSATPTVASTGDVYFDAGAAKMRCFDGTFWQDLF